MSEKEKKEKQKKEDKEKKDQIDTKNQAEQLIYQTEKQMKELDDKLTDDDKKDLNDVLDKLKEANTSTNVDDIKAANDISPAVVAGGISVALLTTLFGLVVAIIIQIIQNYLISRVDKLIIDMEEYSVLLLDELVELEQKGSLKSKKK